MPALRTDRHKVGPLRGLKSFSSCEFPTPLGNNYGSLTAWIGNLRLLTRRLQIPEDNENDNDNGNDNDNYLCNNRAELIHPHVFAYLFQKLDFFLSKLDILGTKTR